MTLAWHGHYATSQAKVKSPELMLAQNHAQRELWRAPISKLHRRMLDDGAMRRWLDGLNSTKAQPNENLAREFLELFALGEGHYTERDVREVARALTGWREVDFQQHRDQLRPRRLRRRAPRRSWARPATGAWTTWCGSPAASRPPPPTSPAGSTGRSSPTPTSHRPSCSPRWPTPCGSTETSTSPEGSSSCSARGSSTRRNAATRRVKSPVDFAIGAVRALELFAPPPDLVDLEIHLTKMGQRLFFPPSVAGWPGGLAWLGGQALVARANFAAWITEPSTWGGKDPFATSGRATWLEDARRAGSTPWRPCCSDRRSRTASRVALRAPAPGPPPDHAAVAFPSRGPGRMNRRIEHDITP